MKPGSTPRPCDAWTSAASRRASRSSPPRGRRWSRRTATHRSGSARRSQWRGSRTGRSSSHACGSRTASGCGGCAGRATHAASWPPLATGSSGSAQVRGRSARRPSWRRRARRASAARVASLTPQEREIAQLAATGLTNREIATRLYVSHRTVSSHLYRIFPKLGITSRAALRDALSEKPSNA